MRPGAAEFGDLSGVAKKLFHPIRGPEFLIGTLVLPYLRQAYEDLKHAASDADLSSSTQLTVRQLSHGRGTLMALTPHVPLRRCNPDGRCRAALRAAT